MKSFRLPTLLFALLMSFFLKGQLTVTNSPPYNTTAAQAQALAANLPVNISNVSYTGAAQQIGFFNGTNSNLGLDSGIVLTTGNILNCPGPNSSGSSGSSAPGGHGLSWSPLQAFISTTMNDLALITFDFVAISDSISFRFVFGSEEYAEYVGGGVNDAMGIFISGPMPGGGVYVDQNIAWAPDTSAQIPISINTLNCQSGSPYYVCNDPNNFACAASYGCPTASAGTTVGYDGFTTPLIARADLIPGQTYTLNIAIADGGDQAWDSGLFIEAGGFGQPGPPTAAFSYAISGNIVNFDASASTNCQVFNWDFGDGTTGSGQTVTHSFPNNGPFLVNLTVEDTFFGGTDSELQAIYMDVGLEEQLSPDHVKILPNPSNGVFAVEFDLPKRQAVELQLYSQAGHVVWEKELKDIPGDYKEVVDTGELASGIYFLHFRSNQGYLVKKVVIR